jgi:hypothetical protein
VAHIAGSDLVPGSGFQSADILKMADHYRLAPFSPRCEMAWRNFSQADPGAARLAVEYVAACRREGAAVNQAADKTLTKAASVVKAAKCLGCFKNVKKHHEHCRKCGRVNPNFVAKGYAVSKKKKGKKAFKSASPSMIRKAAYASATGTKYGKVTTRGEALNTMWHNELASSDPARREVAWRFLNGVDTLLAK